MGKTAPPQTASIVRRRKGSCLKRQGSCLRRHCFSPRGSLVFLPILKIRVMKLSGMVMKLSVLVFFFILFSHLFHFFFTHFGRAEGI